MKTVLGFSLVLAVAFALAGCSKDQGDVMDDMASEMNSLADVLSRIKDGASAKAAVADLEDIAENLKELRKVTESLGEPTEEEAKKLMERMGPMMQATQRAMTEMMRVQSIPEAQAALKDVIEKLEAPAK